jgi:ketosteroid isomerase-like protein
MSRRNVFGGVLVVVCLAACAAPQATPPPAAPAIDTAAEAQAVRDASMAWLQASQARDAAAVDALLATNITTIFSGNVREGLAAVQMNRDKEWAENPDFTTSWTTTEVGVADSGDLAYERGTWTYDPDGAGDAPEQHGEYLTVWKKIDGQWKALYDTGTTIEDEGESMGG